MKRYIGAAALIIALAIVFSVLAQDGGRGRSRVSVNSMGWRKEIDALKAEIAILKAGQLDMISWQYAQLNANIKEAEIFDPTRVIVVCDAAEPTGDKDLTRDEYLTQANNKKLEWEGRMADLQP